MLDEHAEVEEVYQDGGWADEDVGEEGGIDFAEIAGEKAVLGPRISIELVQLI